MDTWLAYGPGIPDDAQFLTIPAGGYEAGWLGTIPAAGTVEWSLRRGLSALAPSEFICTFTLSLFVDPVIVEQSGISYEKSALLRWLAIEPRRDPKTNVAHATDLRFEPNDALAEAIRSWCASGETAAALLSLESEVDAADEAREPADALPVSPEAAIKRELLLGGVLANLEEAPLANLANLAEAPLPELERRRAAMAAAARAESATLEEAAALPEDARAAAAAEAAEAALSSTPRPSRLPSRLSSFSTLASRPSLASGSAGGLSAADLSPRTQRLGNALAGALSPTLLAVRQAAERSRLRSERLRQSLGSAEPLAEPGSVGDGSHPTVEHDNHEEVTRQETGGEGEAADEAAPMEPLEQREVTLRVSP